MENTRLLRLIKDWIVIAIGVFIAAHIVNGISYDSATTLLVVVLLLGIFNMFLKPVLVLITLPFIILTLGLLLWVINALLLLLASALVDGFQVDSFSSALLGSLIISVISLLLGSGRSNYPPSSNRNFRGGKKAKRDDVIDI